MIPGITSHKGSIRVSFAAKVSETTNLKLSLNGSELRTFSIPETSGDYTTASSVNSRLDWEEGAKPEQNVFGLNFMGGGQLSYLDFIRINMKRELKYYGTGYNFFRSQENITKNIQYKIKDINNNLFVWDVTDYNNMHEVQSSVSGNILTFNAPKGKIREFVLIDPSKSFNTPKVLETVTPQNLHGMSPVDMVIISPKAFVTEAERLAQAHHSKSGLDVAVITPELIYNEFSSGTPEATAYRRFMKMFYDRAETEGSKYPRYLLLFGDGMFDNRFIDKSCSQFNKNNFLLTFQVKESLTKDRSYSCDDYFGFLNEKDKDDYGNFKPYSSRKLDLGIGRLPIQHPETAKKLVDKIIGYMNNTNLGGWKNTVVFLADDSDSKDATSSFTMHLTQADTVANTSLMKTHPEYITTKVYMDAFKPEVTGGKVTFNNSAKKKLFNSLDKGCLIFNYTGHGGTVGFADDILTLNDIKNFSYKTLPLWITATCEFTWFDGTANSAGENVLLNEKSGGIALFTTSRVVYAVDNMRLNMLLMQNLIEKKDGKRPALGDVLRLSKNQLGSNDNKMSYFLLGDPALTLNYPEYEVAIDKINGEVFDDKKIYTFKALDHVVISGYIKNESGSIDRNFNGLLTSSVFDGIQQLKTVTKNNKGEHTYFKDYPNLLCTKHTTVKEGEFEMEFTVNLDISNIENLGKINFYASSSGNEINPEAKGYFSRYNLMGTNPEAEITEEGPEINEIYLNSETFKPGDVVNETPYFVASVSDKYGINVSGSGTHNIELIIDNYPATTYRDLSPYYSASSTDPNSGTIAFSIPKLTAGEHTLTFKVWNVMNNSTIHKFKFNVEEGLSPTMSDLRVSSNPIKLGTSAYFEFHHNRPATRLEVTIMVFDLSGRPVWTHTETGSSELMSAYQIPWELKSENGNYIQPGVYVYRASVKSINGSETTDAKKLIVVGQ